MSKILSNFAARNCANMKKTIVFILLLTAWTMVQAESNLSLLDEIVDGKFKPVAPSEMTPLQDGERCAQLKDNSVFAYSYKTGQITDTLFDYTKTKGMKPEKIEGFVLPPGTSDAPVGRYLLVYANSQKIFRRSFSADYYIYDRLRRELRPLSDTMPVLQPVFSPDGKYIAFARENNLYIHKLDFKTEVAVTGGSSVTSGHADGRSILNGIPDWLYEEEFETTCMYAFSPDSKQLSFIRLDERKVPSFLWIDYLDPGVKSLKYSCAGEPNPEASVVVYDTYYKTLKTMQLPEQSESYIPRIKWAGESLAIFRLNRDQNRLEMFLGNPKSTVCNRIYLEESKEFYVDYAAIDEWQFLSDNSFICVNETDGWRHAYLYGPTGQKIKQLTKGQFDVTKVYGYNEKTQTLYYQAAGGSPASRGPLPANGHAVCEPQNRYIYAHDKKGKMQCFSQEEGMHDATFSPTFAYFVDAFQSVTTPTVYTLYDSKGKALRVLEDNHEIADRAKQAGLPVKEFFSFVTPHVDTLNGCWLRPVKLGKQGMTELRNDGGRKSPVLLFHYSGPASQQVLNRWKISWEEFLAAKEGVICVCIDPRGTYARGRKFRNATYMHLGVREAEDQVAAAQWLQTLPFVDAEKIGIWGWSYGGYATIRAMEICDIEPSLTKNGKSPFAFGMAVAPVTDWRFYDSAYTERFMRRPQVNEDGYEDASALKHAAALHGNLLIMHGLSDDNVHPRNTLLFADALTQEGKQFEMQVYPDDNHFLKKRDNQRHVYRRLLKFLRNNL